MARLAHACSTATRTETCLRCAPWARRSSSTSCRPRRNCRAAICSPRSCAAERLYDTWYKENKVEPPTAVHPAYPIPVARDMEPRTTWRCKECHGWDYHGWKGIFRGQGLFDRRRGRVDGRGSRKAIAALRNDVHAYKGLLSERDVADLANFLTKGQANMDLFIDRTTRKARSGSAEYESHFQTICAPCHGADGREIRTMPPLGRIAEPESLARAAWDHQRSPRRGHAGARRLSTRDVRRASGIYPDAAATTLTHAAMHCEQDGADRFHHAGHWPSDGRAVLR